MKIDSRVLLKLVQVYKLKYNYSIITAKIHWLMKESVMIATFKFGRTLINNHELKRGIMLTRVEQ